MPKRDNGVPRRLRWAGLLTAVLVLGTGTAAAQAYWRAQVPLSGTVTAGAFSLSARWGDDWDRWTALYPGQPRDTARLTVTETGASGTTLRWRLSVQTSFSSEFASSVAATVFVDECGSSVTISPGTFYAPPEGFRPGDSVVLCLRVTLSPDASKNLQGKPLVPSVTVVADQVVG